MTQLGSSSRTALFLLVGAGIIALAGAGFIAWQRSAPPAAPPPSTPSTQVLAKPAPLVVQEAPPIPAARDTTPQTTDTATAETTGTPPRRKTKGEGDGQMGTIDPQVLSRFINSRFASVRACYEKRLKINPMLQGTIDLRIGLSRKGTVTHVSVNRDTVGDDVMRQCVISTVKRWQFPAPKGGRVVFDKPFQFKKKV